MSRCVNCGLSNCNGNDLCDRCADEWTQAAEGIARQLGEQEREPEPEPDPAANSAREP